MKIQPPAPICRSKPKFPPNMHYSMILICLAASGLADAGQAQTKPVDKKAHEDHSPDFQAINSFLTSSLHQFNGDQQSVLDVIDQTISLFDGYSADEIANFSQELKELVSDNPQAIASILRSISDASKYCEKAGNLSFMSIIVDHQTFKGQFLNDYALSVIKKCWSSYVTRFSKKVEVSLGKLKFPLVESLVNLYKTFKQATSDGTDDITFQEKLESGSTTNPDLLLEVFRSFKLAPRDRDTLGKAVSRLAHVEAVEAAEALDQDSSLVSFWPSEFLKENFVTPCQLLLDNLARFRSKFDFEKYVGTTLGRALQEIALSNKELAYELQVCRICRFVVDNKDEIIVKDFSDYYDFY